MKPVALAFALAIALSGAKAAASEPVWFEVGSRDPETPQSYLLPLFDEEQIALARQRIAEGENGEPGPIVVARIRPGADGLNRNLRGRDALWSWHVVEFIAFTDLTIELCDGSPQLVDDDPEGFAANTEGVICFWGYTLTAELEAPPAITIDDELDGFWHHTAGSGFLIDVLEAQSMVALAWATFDEGAQGAQRWMVGAGHIEDGRSVIELGQPQAPQADGNQASPVVATAELEFVDCNRARLQLALDSTAPQMLELQRTVPKQRCGGH